MTLLVTFVAWLSAPVVTDVVVQPVLRDPCRAVCERRVYRKREMQRYRRRPMPRCSWWNESGPGLPEWSMRRYRARNATSTAAGKFQLLDTSHHAVGGRDYPGTHDAAKDPPVVQERLARRLLRMQGLGAWVLC